MFRKMPDIAKQGDNAGLLFRPYSFRHSFPRPAGTAALFLIVELNLPGSRFYFYDMMGVYQTAPPAEDETVPKLFCHIL